MPELLKFTPLDSSGAKVVEYSYDAWGNRQVSGSNTTLGSDTEVISTIPKVMGYDPELRCPISVIFI